MNKVIGGYRCMTPMQTTGSGSARWCIAQQDDKRFFLKEFLSPVYPAQTDTMLGMRQTERCIQFEQKKQRLYRAAACVLGNTLIPVVDFFRSDGHYYAVSEAAPENHLTAEKADHLSAEEKRKVLCDLAVCLQHMHQQGVVHADLKPEHVLLIRDNGELATQLIDLDSGFLADQPPVSEREIEGDPAYLAPEAFLKMMGENVALGTALDTFSFGMLIHQIWTGDLPGFDHEKYHYLYEAVLDGADIRVTLPGLWEPLVRRMLCAEPSMRPLDAEIVSAFLKPEAKQEHMPFQNGLCRLMKA